MGVALPGGMVGGGGSRGADSASASPVVVEARTGTGSGPLPRPVGGCEQGSAAPPQAGCCPAPP